MVIHSMANIPPSYYHASTAILIALQGSRQANSTRPLALWPPHYRMRRLLENQKYAAAEEKFVSQASPTDPTQQLVDKRYCGAHRSEVIRVIVVPASCSC